MRSHICRVSRMILIRLGLLMVVVLLVESRRQTWSGESAELQCSALSAAALPARMIVVGDLHGDLDALGDVLVDAGMVSESARCEWRGGDDAVVVQLGDVVDRGPTSEAANECLRALQSSAPEGAVVRLTGNHELMWAEGDFRFASRYETADVRRRAVNAWLDEVSTGKVRGAYARGPLLFTHAGFRPAMLALLDPANRANAHSLAAYVNRSLIDAVRRCGGSPPCTFDEPIFSAGPDRGGAGVGGAFWTDFGVLASANLPPGLVQIVGHSAARCDARVQAQCDPIRFRSDLAAICVDAGLSVAYASNRAYLDVRSGRLVARTLGLDARWREYDVTDGICTWANSEV